MSLDTLTDTHREILGARTRLDKFAVPTHKDLTTVQQRDALNELCEAGLVEWIDTYFNREVRLMLEVYRLTDAGRKLCADHGIEARNP